MIAILAVFVYLMSGSFFTTVYFGKKFEEIIPITYYGVSLRDVSFRNGWKAGYGVLFLPAHMRSIICVSYYQTGERKEYHKAQWRFFYTNIFPVLHFICCSVVFYGWENGNEQ